MANVNNSNSGLGPLARLVHHPQTPTVLELLTLVGFTVLFFFYGMVPILGGDSLGLVGADEPRYAQVAQEMLTKLDAAHNMRERFDACVTPYLYGKPWLEKPALYYWRAMFSFREFGVHDWSARVPSASFAFTLVVLIYLHMRRFRPGGQLDAALITASCAGMLGFARGASTDMQLAAPFCIGMLGWYAWYETNSKFWLFDLYFFVGAATLAKGPIAPFMAVCIITTFAALRREWSLLRRSIWIPGILLYLAMVLPWFIAVQRRNPTFFKEFFLEHNLERFATNRYQHEQHWWYYLAVLLLALTPWTVLALRSLVDAIAQSIAEWKARRAPDRYLGNPRAGDAFPEFLVLWALFPILFFSLSHSRLPGYILPSIAPVTILTGDYLNRIRARGIKFWLLASHAGFVALTTATVLMLPWFVSHNNSLPPLRAVFAAAITGLAAALLVLLLVVRFGLIRLRVATLLPVVMLLVFIFGVGPFFGHGMLPGSKRTAIVLDTTYSARPMVRLLDRFSSPGEPVAVFKVRRDMEYGLAFYRNHKVLNYQEPGGVPDEQHLLVIRESFLGEVNSYLKGRSYEPLFVYPAQDLVVYRVNAR